VGCAVGCGMCIYVCMYVCMYVFLHYHSYYSISILKLFSYFLISSFSFKHLDPPQNSNSQFLTDDSIGGATDEIGEKTISRKGEEGREDIGKIERLILKRPFKIK